MPGARTHVQDRSAPRTVLTPPPVDVVIVGREPVLWLLVHLKVSVFKDGDLSGDRLRALRILQHLRVGVREIAERRDKKQDFGGRRATRRRDEEWHVILTGALAKPQ